MPVTVQLVASRPKTLQQQAVTAPHPGNLLLAAEAQPKLQHAAEILAIPPTSSKSLAQPPTLSTASANLQHPQPADIQPATVNLQSATFQELLEEHNISEEEMQAFLQDIGEESDVVVSKKRRLKASEKNKLRSDIASIDVRALQDSIVLGISKMVHITGILERRKFWEHFKCSPWMFKSCEHFLSEYVKLHKQCDKGADKYAIFYLSWHEQLQSTNSSTPEFMKICHEELSKSYNCTISEDMWITLVTTLLHVFYTEIQLLMANHIQAIEAPTPSLILREENDVALLRLGGWALHSCITFRRKSLKTKSSKKRAEKLRNELLILDALVDDKKVGLPSAINAQDRGYMTFPCPSMMPFIRDVNAKIKECINPLTYEKHGSKLFDFAAKEVLSSEQLKSEWVLVASSLSSCLESVSSTGQALMIKMLHSQFQEFARNTRTLEALGDGKCADVDVALRAKLKTYASEKKDIKVN